MKKKIGFLAVVFSVATAGFAQQDKHFSMFAESPVYLNPAAAGFFPGDIQLFSNYRMQWMTVSAEPFTTISAGTDWRMFDNGNFMGAGVNFYNDLSGDTQYMTNEVTFPINYAIQIAKDNHFSIGLQPAWYQRTLTNTDVTWDNQWTGTEFNTTYSSNEILLNEKMNISRFDISAGAYWYANLSKTTRLAFGLAGHHLSKQRINFMSADSRMYRKLTLHGQCAFKQENTNMTIIPAFYGFIQGPNKELTVGSNFRFLLRGSSRVTGYFEEIALSFGTFYRIGDAVMANMMFDISGLTIGASYDLNISRLTVASNGVGAFEVFLRYRIQFGAGMGSPSIH